MGAGVDGVAPTASHLAQQVASGVSPSSDSSAVLTRRRQTKRVGGRVRWCCSAVAPVAARAGELWKLFGRGDVLALLAAAVHVSAASRKRVEDVGVVQVREGVEDARDKSRQQNRQWTVDDSKTDDGDEARRRKEAECNHLLVGCWTQPDTNVHPLARSLNLSTRRFHRLKHSWRSRVLGDANQLQSAPADDAKMDRCSVQASWSCSSAVEQLKQTVLADIPSSLERHAHWRPF